MLIQWAINSAKGRSEGANGSRLLNLFAEAMPQDSKTPVVVYGTPGCKPFASGLDSAVLALHRMNNVLYAVTKDHLYVIDSDGVATSVGFLSIYGTRVSTADNGFILVIVDGASGYSYSESDGLNKITADGFYPSKTVAYQDGYFIFSRSGTGQFFVSELLSIDFNANKYATAEGAPDNTESNLSDHRECWLFGEESTEVWYNSGDPDFPFERLQGAFIERGIIAPHSAKKVDNSVIWLGDDKIVYRANGYIPQRISTHAVEFDIKDRDLANAFAYIYSDEGHTFYVLTMSDKTWVYDVSTKLWHERDTYKKSRHLSNCHVRCYDKNLVGDFENGNIYELDMNHYTDDETLIRRLAVSPPISNQRKRVVMHSFELDMESGIGMNDGQGDDPQAMLQFSDDGGNTWSNEKWSKIGKMGEYLSRTIWHRLGQFRQRQIRIRISDPIPVVILSAFARLK